MSNLENQTNFLFYTSDSGITNIQVILGEDTVWVTQSSMAEIFDTTKQNISLHLSNIYNDGELNKFATVKEILTVQKEGNRNVQRNIEFFNLDAIISVGYRVNSNKATLFRIWATSILKEYLVKGFALDDDRLKQGKTLFDKDYFDELIERIREIRASERRFYQKITDIYAQCSVDYDPKANMTQTFFATVQNKLEYAITHHTAPEIIKLRASSKKLNMGLTSWKNEKKGGKIMKSDVGIAKNYLKHEEIGELNQIVNMYLDYAELQAKKNRLLKMSDWAKRLDTFLAFNEYDILRDSGKIKASFAKQFAQKEYGKFRVIQDKEYKSDFDKVIGEIKMTGKLPSKENKMFGSKDSLKKLNKEDSAELSDFNKNLKKATNFNPNKNKKNANS